MQVICLPLNCTVIPILQKQRWNLQNCWDPGQQVIVSNSAETQVSLRHERYLNLHPSQFWYNFSFWYQYLQVWKKSSLIKLNVKYILKIFFIFVLSSWEEEDTSDFLPGFILMAKMAVCVTPGILFKHTYFSLHVNSNLQKDKYCPWLKNHIKKKKKKKTMEERNLPSVSLKDDTVIRVWDYQTPPRNGDAPFWKSACPWGGYAGPNGPQTSLLWGGLT